MQDGWYYIKNVGTQKYLQVVNNTGADGANVEVGTGTGVAGQKWYLTNKSDGYVTLKNALGYMLDIQYGEKNDGTNIQIYSDNGADAQRFKIVKTSASNVYGITTKITSDAKALKVDGTNVCQYAYDAGTQQQWVLESTSYTEPGTSTDATLLNTYGKVFGYSGTCINVSELKNAEMLAFLKKHYNSITLENEMKPDAILRAWSKQLITVEEAKALGYYIPSNYTDKYVPKLNFDTVDEALKICYENGLKMRAHTLVWHSQTPTFFFRKDYDASGSYVSSSVMDARMEFYIRTVMNHVYDSKYGKDVVYAWDVVNEYLNARTTSSSDWVKVYGEQGTSADFVKKAFTIASDVLSKYDLKGKVSLFYNDFNTYMNANDVVSLINYVNGSGKVCDGIGMQSHLGTDFPSPSYYKEALTKFKNAGFEIQITELDVANLKGLDQPQYYYDIAAAILATKKSGGNITGFTLWGMWDSLSWITKMEGKENTTPLLFTGIDKPKDDYYKVIKAYTDAGYTIGGSGSGGSTGGTTVDDTGYTRVDLSTATAGSYNSSDKKLTLSDALSTRINLPTTVKAGQTAKVIINVTYNGSSGFRAWLTNASESNLSEQFRSSEADLSGDVVITFTATQDSEYLLFKGPDYQTNIDNLTVNYVKVKVDTTSSVTLDKSYSEYNGSLVNNPLVTNKYLADPTCIVYNGRVYVYGTAERFEFDENGTPTENKFKTSSLSVISSSDLVNWTDEGEIDVKAITNGWAGNSWAPSITSKVINGKTYFFLYFANGGNGIGVLRSTSPLGPWEDPLGKALITRNTDNCSNVLWLFDPAAFVDDDGTGYLAFGGGVPDGQQANPKTGRIVKLGSDMISLDGTPQLIDAPYLFEDSELNKINGKYVYSYCKNWNTPDGTSATIAYMTSNNPMSGYTYKGVIVKNPGTYFGLTSNNHHHMFEFNGSWYILYHTLYLEKAMYGTSVGYRSLNIDKVNIANDGTISSTMTYAGVSATQALNPYSVNNATTMAWNGGIKTVYDSQKSAMVIDDAKTGNWIGISNVAFGTKGSDKVTFNVSTTSTCTIDVYLDAPTVAKGGKKVGYALISANSADYRDVTATLTEKITGTHDLYFVFAGPGVDVATWKFTEANAGSSQQAVTHTHNFTEAGSTSSFYAITGNTSTSKGSVTYNGLSLKTCLKMESTTNIAFTAPKAGKLTLVFGGDTNAAGKSVKVNGTSKTIGSDGVLTLDLAAGSHTITKGDAINLFYMSYATEGESHTHSYTSSVTKEATCGTTGVKTYTCSCGDSYTEAIAATGHSYSSEWTIDVEATTTSAGEKSRHCTNCSARTDITVIPKVEIKNGLILENGNYYYYVDGAVATDYTGLVYSGSIWWYVENGVLNTGYTGTFTNSSGTWYIINGQLDSNYVGIRKNGSEFWYVVNGKVNTAFVGLYNYADAWWYITDGKIQTSYSGIVDYSGYKWFVSGGKVDITYTGLKKDNLGTFYCVQAGKVNLDYTGLVQNAGAWWYIVDGVLDTGMTGIIESGGSQWLVATGKLQSGYTGNYMYKNVTYVITNGKVVGTK